MSSDMLSRFKGFATRRSGASTDGPPGPDQVETGAGPAPKGFDWSFKPFLLLGYATLAILVLGLGGWGVYARIAGAVIAMGTVEVEGNRQVVQHPVGGVVTEIFARDGDVVAKGDVILRLEGDTQRAEFQTVEGQYFELVARQNRLEALRDDKDSIAFDEELVARSANEQSLQELLTAQQGQFEASRDTLHKEQSQLDERSAQIEKQIEGLEFQLAATREQVDLTAQELAAQETLMSQGLTQLTRVLSLRRDLAQLKGTQGAAQASVAENRGKISEIDLEKLKIENKQRDDAIAELREIEFREIELRSRRKALGDEIARLDIRAPVSGVVYGSTADTLRGGAGRRAHPLHRAAGRGSHRSRPGRRGEDRPGACGPDRDHALLGLRRAHDPGRRRQGHQGLCRHLHRRAHRARLLSC